MVRRLSYAPRIESLHRRLLLSADGYVPMTQTIVLDDVGNPLGYTQSVVPTGGVKIAPKDAVVSASGGVQENTALRFNISLQLDEESLTPAQQDVFRAAAAKWETILTADIPNVAAGPWGGAVDDIRISAAAIDIDGAGAVLGFAEPQFKRAGSSLPINGVMRFDVADIPNLEATGRFSEVILHEMGHVLGIGTIWTDRALQRRSIASTPTIRP
jgi:hypothetical protein